jgi:hypothetical protein
MVSFAKEKISAKELHEILAMIENEKKKNSLSPEITIVYLKIKLWKHYLFIS